MRISKLLTCLLTITVILIGLNFAPYAEASDVLSNYIEGYMYKAYCDGEYFYSLAFSSKDVEITKYSLDGIYCNSSSFHCHGLILDIDYCNGLIYIACAEYSDELPNDFTRIYFGTSLDDLSYNDIDVLMPSQSSYFASDICGNYYFTVFNESGAFVYTKQGNLINYDISDTIRNIIPVNDGQSICIICMESVYLIDAYNPDDCTSISTQGSIRNACPLNGNRIYFGSGMIMDLNSFTQTSTVSANSPFSVCSWGDTGITGYDNAIYKFNTDNGNYEKIIDCDGYVLACSMYEDTLFYTEFVGTNVCVSLCKNINDFTKSTDTELKTVDKSNKGTDSDYADKTNINIINVFIYSVDYKVDILNNLIYDLHSGTTVTQLKESLNLKSWSFSYKNYKGVTKTSGLIGTGSKVYLGSDADDYCFNLIVNGDVTGEGNVNYADMDALSEALYGNKTLSSCASLAADLNEDGYLSTVDLLRLHKLIIE